jgi:two-component system, sensor histidine kinase
MAVEVRVKVGNVIRNRTVGNRFNIIIGLIVVILVFALINFWFSMKIMASIRAYVNGEGLWSKAQKESVNYLVKYSSSHDEADYRKFKEFLEVPQGDRQARLELDKSQPDMAVARQGFIQGGNNPKDVDNLIFLYQHFRSISYMKSAVNIWQRGDVDIARLVADGGRVHAAVLSGQPTQPLLGDIYATDSHVTGLEDDFSGTLGAGGRSIATTLTELTVLITTVLGALTIAIAVLVALATIQLDKAKTEFVSLASHQLRTPLTTIAWYAEALLASKSKRSARERKQLQELYDASQKATQLVGDLLSVSRLELGAITSEPRLVDLPKLVKAVLKIQQPAIRDKQLQVILDIGDLPRLKLDPRLLSVVLQNLLANSVKYTPKHGHITISVKARKSSVILSVADDGMGIPRDEQSQIFSKLYRASNAQQADDKNTGLGLYVAKAMIGKLHGSIWFESEEGRGSTFYVKLPI